MDDEQTGPHAADVAPGAASDDADGSGVRREASEPAAPGGPQPPAAAGGDDTPQPASADAGQTALSVAPEPTGISAVDTALGRLGDLENAPLDEHVVIFDAAQQQLHDALAELDDEQ
jgi:hypothetical protein